MSTDTLTAAEDFKRKCRRYQCGTILAEPPWQFTNRTGKMAPEHKRLNRYETLTLKEIKEIPVPVACAQPAHLYLWVPNALLREGLDVMDAWGFTYKTNVFWHKIRKDGGPDGRGVGFYFLNTTELVLFGVRGSLRTPCGQNIQPDRKLSSSLVLRTWAFVPFRPIDRPGWPPNPADCEGDNARRRIPLNLLIARNLLRSDTDAG